MDIIDKKHVNAGQKRSIAQKLARTSMILIFIGLFIRFYLINSQSTDTYFNFEVEKSLCQQYDYKYPKSFIDNNSVVLKIINDPFFRNQSALKLSKAVQIKTDTYDEDPLVEEDPKYWEDKFKPFHNYLKSTFPKIWNHPNITIETVNGWGLIVTWKGENKDLKPILLTAHQDVVPTQPSTLKDWTYPPYDGHYDGEKLWGRGSADCKNLLIGLLESGEELINFGFKPKRTVIYAFGFDEELGGERGAKYISQFLVDKYGKDSFYIVVDEGGQSIAYENGVLLALPGTGEKGATDIVIGLNTPGGHSSVPPNHTSIGIISKLISLIEDNPFESIFSPKNPTFHEWQCIAKYSNELPRHIKHAILNAEYSAISNKIARDYLSKQSLITKYLISTSSAIDIIHGGVKSNALPEYVEVLINHRIAIESTFKETLKSDISKVKTIADKFDLGIILNDDTIKNKTKNGYFTIKANSVLEPAPITPTTGKVWELFSGNIRHVYEQLAFKDPKSPYFNKSVIVAPGIATGNTDTKYYWNLTNNIYRYRPGLTTSVEAHAHGVDEHILFDSHLQIIAFYFEYLQMINEQDSEND
ncbi:unnamed protein product [Candida verbasci]|uniref:Peptidase M20 dimerisation domain-containing protein n=1 Tax=Candida verbasci TaxID=1227364 RepID=A0A9W4XNN4_9ASCO|nr:unnamed protein product [Candida verbasci]